MKRVDLTKSVMDKVTRFEKERSTGLLWRSRVYISVLIAAGGYVAWRVWNQLRESQTLDLLSLFWEDAEIIKEFWQDTVSVFLEELPTETIVMGGVIFVGLIFYIWFTHKKRRIAKRRLAQLAKKP
jgi:hypothetical protein